MASSSSKLVCFALALAAAAVLGAPCAAQNSPQDYLDQHNTARSEVGVDPVSWDDTVAAYAQSYASQRQGDCALVHSWRANLFWGSAGADWSWVSEKQFYDHDSNSCLEGQTCGHHTQVVWRDTTAIGCARVVCDNDGGVFIICSYNPPGNFVGEIPY
ncbi:hypothetical protein EJB05_14448, partial [Eragrostis curvula]